MVAVSVCTCRWLPTELNTPKASDMDRPLRISLITETFFPQVNGVSRTLDRLVDYCSGCGDRIQLLTPRYEQEPKLHHSVEAVSWRSVSLPFYPEVILPLVTTGTVANTLKRFQPDLVHIATEGTLGRAALQACRRLGLPVVSSYHTNFPQYLRMYRAGLLEPLCWRYLRWFHNATRMTFCPAPSTRNVLQQQGFRNVEIWSRGVDSFRFSPSKRDDRQRESFGVGADEILMVYVGRLAAEKNLEMLMAAWQKLPNRQDCRLLLIGDGPLRKKLEAGADDRTIFAGYRYGEELARMFASSDLFVFPSLTETFGNVVLEAMASGLPAIGFDVQGPGDIIDDGNTGRLAGRIDASDLSAVMHALSTDHSERFRMGRMARQYAEAQSWENIMGGLRGSYCKTLDPEANALEEAFHDSR